MTTPPVALSVAGCAIIAWGSAGDGSGSLTGDGLAVLGGMCAAGYLMMGRLARQRGISLISYVALCYGGADDAGFSAWLTERCYDLHYAARPGAQIFSFGFGNLWRIATQCPGSPVPPCIHRAPVTRPGQAPRLLLIS